MRAHSRQIFNVTSTIPEKFLLARKRNGRGVLSTFLPYF